VSSFPHKPRRWLLRAVWLLAVVGGLILAGYVFRASLLTGLAEAWVVNEPATKADAIVILGGGLENRPFAAARLFHDGVAPRILYMNTVSRRKWREESGKGLLAVTFCGHDAHGKTSGRTHRAAQRESRLSAAAPSHAGEKRVADFLATVAARAGLEVEFQKVLARRRSNLIARLLPRNKIRQTILLAPHLDTVGADGTRFIPQRKNGRLHGRGACDTKGSVAAMLSALCELANAKSRPLETEIVFAGLIDEEHAQAGSRALARADSRRTWPSSASRRKLQVVTAHKGSLWLELETRGKAAHGATPQFGKNAIHEMARIVDLLETDYAAQLQKRNIRCSARRR
jgi:hypothetical protein